MTPTTPKEAFIKAVKQANISVDDWMEDCLPHIASLPYARGYIARYTTEVGNCLSSDTEDYREEFLKLEEYDIWK